MKKIIGLQSRVKSQASINIAEVDQDISVSHASYLRETFLFYDEEPDWNLFVDEILGQ